MRAASWRGHQRSDLRAAAPSLHTGARTNRASSVCADWIERYGSASDDRGRTVRSGFGDGSGAGLPRAARIEWKSVPVAIQVNLCRNRPGCDAVSSLRSELSTHLPTLAQSGQMPSDPFLQVKGLRKRYILGGLWRNRMVLDAVKEVDFEIARGRTFALVGESGSGKSTVARCLTRLARPDGGQILIQGTDIARLHSADLAPFRTSIQMVFQDAVTAMNPRFSAREVIEEPMRINARMNQPGLNPDDRRDRVRALMIEVGLSSGWMERSILHFSGGQRQRLALARALALRPQFLVLDEALSGLDLSTQAQIANLLLDLQAAHSLTYLLISHDVALVARLADAIGIMSEGKTVEVGPTEQILSAPAHEATRGLLASAKAAAASLVALTGTPA